jgi:hypothetical protein
MACTPKPVRRIVKTIRTRLRRAGAPDSALVAGKTVHGTTTLVLDEVWHMRRQEGRPASPIQELLRAGRSYGHSALSEPDRMFLGLRAEQESQAAS